MAVINRTRLAQQTCSIDSVHSSKRSRAAPRVSDAADALNDRALGAAPLVAVALLLPAAGAAAADDLPPVLLGFLSAASGSLVGDVWLVGVGAAAAGDDLKASSPPVEKPPAASTSEAVEVTAALTEVATWLPPGLRKLMVPSGAISTSITSSLMLLLRPVRVASAATGCNCAADSAAGAYSELLFMPLPLMPSASRRDWALHAAAHSSRVSKLFAFPLQPP